MAQDEPKTAQDEPKTAQDEPKTAQDEPKTAQDEAKTAQDEPKTAQRGAFGRLCWHNPTAVLAHFQKRGSLSELAWTVNRGRYRLKITGALRSRAAIVAAKSCAACVAAKSCAALVAVQP